MGKNVGLNQLHLVKKFCSSSKNQNTSHDSIKDENIRRKFYEMVVSYECHRSLYGCFFERPSRRTKIISKQLIS